MNTRLATALAGALCQRCGRRGDDPCHTEPMRMDHLWMPKLDDLVKKASDSQTPAVNPSPRKDVP